MTYFISLQNEFPHDIYIGLLRHHLSTTRIKQYVLYTL